MRLGVVIDAPAGPTPLREASAVEGTGLDLCWVTATDADGATRSAAAVGAAIAATTTFARIVIELPCDRHPIEVAEELAVTDQLSNGRVTGALGPGEVDDEAVEIVLAGLTSRPFRHEGTRWVLPAEGGGDSTIRVTPGPCQPSLPLWLVGSGLSALAVRRGLVWVPQASDAHEAAAGRAPGPRPAIVAAEARADGRALDPDALLSAQLAARDKWGMDTCLVRLPATLSPSDRLKAIALLGHRVRPRLQLERLPAELVASWDATAGIEGDDAHA